MLQTLWFFIKITLIVGATVWLATRTGSVDINVMDYSMTLHAGVFFIALLLLLVIVLITYRVFRAVVSVPQVLARYQEKDRRKKGYKALTRGLVAVAAGDAKKATYFSRQTKQLLPNENGLPILLEAQAARLRGEEGLAQNRFQELMKDKDAAFLGIRGLMKSALDEGNLALALDYAHQAQKIYPKQGWILKMVYTLEIKNCHWTDAIETGRRAAKVNAISQKKIISDRIAIHLMRSDYEFAKGDQKLAAKELDRAYKLNPHFVPTAVRMAEHYLHNNKKRKAVAVIEKAWAKNPHPELANIWDSMAPENNSQNVNKRLKWYESLVSLKPDSAESQITAARAAMDMELWGEAKAYLMIAEKIYPSARLFRLRAIVEQNSTHNDNAIHDLMEKASEALPDKAWVCQETGLVYDEWSAIATPHESFNTIVWDIPGAHAIKKAPDLLQESKSALLIDPAA